MKDKYTFDMKKLGLEEPANELREQVSSAFESAKLSQGQVDEVMTLFADQINKLTDQLMNAPRTDLSQEQNSLQLVWKDNFSNNIKAVRQFADTLPKRLLELPLVDTAEGIQFLHQLMQQNIKISPVSNQSQSTNNVIHFKKLH